jgi:hypothetical protein
MATLAKPRLADLDRRELHLTLFACSAIAILAIGTAVLMYPVVFSEQTPANRTTRVAFFGFCTLCLLLAGYLLERQKTIQQLRAEMAEDRRRALESEAQASEELLKTMPKLNSFQDSLPMEFRRTAATTNNLSILVVTLTQPGSPAGKPVAALSDTAKIVSRKLRDRDSMFILGPACIGAVLPGADMQTAQGLSTRIDDSLAGAAKSGRSFSYTIRIVNYPADATSAHELQQSVCALIPSDSSLGSMAEEALI